MHHASLRARAHGFRTKGRVGGQEARRAAANYVFVRAANPGAATAGDVVAPQVFTPRVSGRVRATACVSGICSVDTAVVTLTVTLGGQTYSMTVSPTTTNLNVALDAIFTGLVVGTQVAATFSWLVSGGVNTFDPASGQGTLLLQELPN